MPYSFTFLQVGTHRYMSPELLASIANCNLEGLKMVDVYAAALIMWEVSIFDLCLSPLIGHLQDHLHQLNTLLDRCVIIPVSLRAARSIPLYECEERRNVCVHYSFWQPYLRLSSVPIRQISLAWIWTTVSNGASIPVLFVIMTICTQLMNCSLSRGRELDCTISGV